MNNVRQTHRMCTISTLTLILRVPAVRKHETGSVSGVTHLGDTDERVGHFGSFDTRSYASAQELKQKAVSSAYINIYIYWRVFNNMTTSVSPTKRTLGFCPCCKYLTAVCFCFSNRWFCVGENEDIVWTKAELHLVEVRRWLRIS